MIYEPLPHRAYKPSPAVSFVGRQNSGKTTLLEKVIAELAAQGLSIGTLKHHGHSKFQIDIPGKDSYRHRAAGASQLPSSRADAWHLPATLPASFPASRRWNFFPTMI